MPNKKLKENKHESKVIKFSNALQRDCILILGMKNSGEAAVSEGIHDIYNLHFTRKNTINSKPEKYKARKEISFLNDKLLAHFGLGWDSITSLPENWKDEIDNFGDRQNLKTLLLDNFNYDGPIIINDSKLLLVLPIWLDLLKELDYNTKVVIVHRHPNQVALAYKERENFSTNKSHLIYINYMKLAEKLTRNLNRIVVDYDQLSKSPEKIITESIRILDNNLTPGLTCDLENILPLLQQNEVVNKIFVSEKEESIVERTCLKLNKLYRSILNGSQNNLVYTKLDVLYNRYDEDFAAFYKGILYAHNNLSKLVLSFKNGNQKVLTQQIQKGRQIISFDIKQLNDIESVSFYPSN